MAHDTDVIFNMKAHTHSPSFFCVIVQRKQNNDFYFSPLLHSVSLKDEDFCLDLDLLEFNAMLIKLDEEILSRDRDGFVPTPKNSL